MGKAYIKRGLLEYSLTPLLHVNEGVAHGLDCYWQSFHEGSQPRDDANAAVKTGGKTQAILNGTTESLDQKY